MLYKCTAGQAPNYLWDNLVKFAANSPYCTRGSVQGNPRAPKCSSGPDKRTFKYRGSVA